MHSPNNYIDHTLLKSIPTIKDITRLCKEAMEFEFYSVCINSCYVKLAKELLQDSKVKVCTVVGFPLGTSSQKSKMEEASRALIDGAQELDIVVNLGLYKSGEKELVAEEISQIKSIASNDVLKVIIETCYLNSEEIKDLCRICEDSGADFVKTSTGFGTAGATLENVQLMKQVLGISVKIKASGGIKTLSQLDQLVEMGANRIGTSSGVSIMQEYKSISRNI